MRGDKKDDNITYINTRAKSVVFSREVATNVCNTLAAGLSLVEACKKHPAFPTAPTFRLWLEGRGVSDDDCVWLVQEHAAAERARADAFVDNIWDIANDSSNDWIEETRADGTTFSKPNTQHILRTKIRIDAIQWGAARINSEKYGTKNTLEVKVKPLPPEERDARLNVLMIEYIKYIEQKRLEEEQLSLTVINSDDG